MKRLFKIAGLLSICLLFLSLYKRSPAGNSQSTNADPLILLNGTIVTPQKIIPDGWIMIKGEKISSVHESKPKVYGAVEIETGGIIFPGLIDLHNHISWNILPRWKPPHTFQNRYEWRQDTGNLKINKVYSALENFFCEMNAYGEIRSLVGGTTSMLSTRGESCIAGLVRNLDHESGFYQSSNGDELHVRNKVFMDQDDVQPLNCLPTRNLAPIISSTKMFLANENSDIFLIHLSEGIDSISKREFCFLENNHLLTKKTAIVHGLALEKDQFEKMKAAHSSLIWSPKSNMVLYGRTADIPAALKSGIRIALAPDWGITGSDCLLSELRFANHLNSDSFQHVLTDSELVMLVTMNPALIANIDDKVGSIQPGLFADLLVISGNRRDPYHSLVHAGIDDVQLVFVNGEPVYGKAVFMNLFWKNYPALSFIAIYNSQRLIKLPFILGKFSDLKSKLQRALLNEGTTLAPIYDANAMEK
jgi:cytosine/adenosine deaminase-related metal-dependent hydrolase